MNNKILLCLIPLMLYGCASTRYGYTQEEWSNMTQQERDIAIQQAENMIEDVDAREREKDFIYQPVNAIFGSRSNTY